MAKQKYVIRQISVLGCKVIATTHREEKLPLIAEADEAVIDDGVPTGKISGVTKALDLVGPRNLRDTLTAIEKRRYRLPDRASRRRVRAERI